MENHRVSIAVTFTMDIISRKLRHANEVKLFLPDQSARPLSGTKMKNTKEDNVFQEVEF